ncbi:MAG: cytidylate kinase-like family protein [Eubacteriales bacterium]|nr:cytidylate kinase-like family protein [Eubacteriales bacterium]
MKNIITISRQFGSGGRSIGKAVAERLGYDYFDKDLIERIAKESGLSKDYIEKNGEHSPGTNIFSYAFVGRNRRGESVEDYLWNKQREVILNIADKGNCVIVGRCADYILRDRENCLNVFVHSDIEKRAERIVKLYGETDQKPKKRLMDKDRTRKLNYKYYTDRDWGMSQNYHLSLDSGVIGIERCEELIATLAQEL